MGPLWKAASIAVTVAMTVTAAAYLTDVHRCQRANYEDRGASLPRTFIVKSGYCLELAGSTRLRGYAR
jgi:hypothetical protein